MSNIPSPPSNNKNRRRFSNNRNKNRKSGGGGNSGGQNNNQQGLPMDVEDYLAEEEANAQKLLLQRAAAAAAPQVFVDENGQPLPPGAIPPGYDAPIPPPPEMSDDTDEAEDGRARNYASNGQAAVNSGPAYEPKVVHIAELKKQSAAALLELAESLGLENIARTKKQDLILALLKAAARRGDHIMADGVMEVTENGGYGFLRTPDSSYLAGPDDVYVSPSQVRRFNLRTGDTVHGRVRSPKDGEKFFALLRVDGINFEPPEASRRKVSFENLTPLYC